MTPQEQGTTLIQVLEDEAEIGRLICSTLADYGFRCELSGTGRQFLARSRLTNPDLCIIDLGLPDMDGMQVVRELQEKQPCAVLILTGRNDVTDRVLGLELGADDYLVKPSSHVSWSPGCAPSCGATSRRRQTPCAATAQGSPALPAGSLTSSACC